MAEVVAREVRFNVLRMGAGSPAIVCVHGLAIDNHSSFYLTLAPALARQASVVLYDLRGHGLSEQPERGYTIDDMAADLYAIIDALQLRDQPVVVLGHSLGGYIALRFAASYPGRAAGLILIESPSGLADIGEQMAACLTLSGEARIRKIEELFTHWLTKHVSRGTEVPADDARVDDARAMYGHVQRHRQRRRNPLIETSTRLMENTQFVADMSGASALDDAAIASIDCPVLALYGADSDRRDDAERLARLLPRCELQLIPGCAHGVLFNATQKVRASILEWLPRIRG
ncbi:MAG TPA: alpha/beta fold hydrolase [Casimicrobiaceae bacterium]|nr:alpha/beta fold hydrolase [Casimicrobiaceae bacterium]